MDFFGDVCVVLEWITESPILMKFSWGLVLGNAPVREQNKTVVCWEVTDPLWKSKFFGDTA